VDVLQAETASVEINRPAIIFFDAIVMILCDGSSSLLRGALELKTHEDVMGKKTRKGHAGPAKNRF
jgi:hypothetical protein